MLAVIMGIGVGAVMLMLQSPDAFWPRLLNIGILVTVGTIIYGGGAMFLRMPELQLIFKRR